MVVVGLMVCFPYINTLEHPGSLHCRGSFDPVGSLIFGPPCKVIANGVNCSLASVHCCYAAEMANPDNPPSDQNPRSPLPKKLGHWPHNRRPHGARIVLNDFFRKVLKLSALRLVALRLYLQFKPLNANDILHQVYNAIQFALYERTELFYNRHLDQILLSSIYGVCKVNQLKNISFREIIQQYKTQPQARPEVYKTVILKQSDPELEVRNVAAAWAYGHRTLQELMEVANRLHFYAPCDCDCFPAEICLKPFLVPAEPGAEPSFDLSSFYSFPFQILVPFVALVSHKLS